MKIVKLNPKKSLNKAVLKQRPLRSEIALFKTNLIRLLDKVDEIPTAVENHFSTGDVVRRKNRESSKCL